MKIKINEKLKIKVLSFLVKNFYTFESWFYNSKNINFPQNKPVIFALWHAHQCGLYSLEDRGHVNIMVSKSNDGEIIASAVERVGLKTIRGSHKRAGAAASLTMLEKLEQGECAAITIDGPRGPKGIVKDGVSVYAKLFFENDPDKKNLINRISEKYGDLPTGDRIHPPGDIARTIKRKYLANLQV